MIINTTLDTEDFVHLYYPEDDAPRSSQGCGAGARRAAKFSNRPPAPEFPQVTTTETATAYEMCERGVRAAPPAELPPRRARAADTYPRPRAHYDEPDLDAPFAPICGEFVQYVGRTSDGGVLAMSNYRLHVQARRRRGAGVSVPLRLVDAVEVRDLLLLVVLCKDGRTLRCTFGTGEQCAEWWRRVSSAAGACAALGETFAAAYAAWARELPPASAPRALLEPQKNNQNHWFKKEVERLGFTERGAWRVSAVNAEYKLCPSYPPLLVVPACVGDEELDAVARFRAMRRVPAVVWRHRGNGAVLARSSQPEVGWLGWRSSEDERLLAAFVAAAALDRGLQPPATAAKQQARLLIVDARSYTSAVTNRARGGGCECAQYYPGADIQFMCLPNIHHVRKSFHQLRQLAGEPPDQPNWHGALERTLWLQHLSGLGRAAALAARTVLAGRPVLVHCSDGWDRTPQIVAAAQLLLDPYYRTVEGFRVLVEREWLDFGHKFADRCGHGFGPEEPNERSPIFLQWLDLVHQIMLQYPCSFEFSQAYLIKLVTHAHSCLFGTFLCNSPRERCEARVREGTAHVWRLLEAPAYRNHLYAAPAGEHPLWPDYSVRSLAFWWALYVGARGVEPEEGDAETAAAAATAPSSRPDRRLAPPPPPPPETAPHGAMTKTRSCDNLLSEVDKPPAQRRRSDPSLAQPDIIKMASLSLPSSESASSLGRPPGSEPTPALTDSYFDGLDGADGADGARDSTDGGRMSDELSDQTDLSASSASSDAPPPRMAVLDQVDGLHLNHFENGEVRECPAPAPARDITSNSSSLERELASGAPPAVGAPAAGAAGSPDATSVFLDDNYGDLINVPELLPVSSRERQISITWRSVSESSHHTDSSAGYEPAEVRASGAPERRAPLGPAAPRPDPRTNGAQTNGELRDLRDLRDLRERDGGMDDSAVRLLAGELGNLTTGTSSSLSSESEEECERACREGRAARCRPRGRRSRTANAHTYAAAAEAEAVAAAAACGSERTLCPNSPSVRAASARDCCSTCCYCCRRASSNGSVEASTDTLVESEPCCCGPGGAAPEGQTAREAAARVRCACGGGAGGPAARDPVDGLPASHSPVQARLHQIILQQKLVVEELSGQLRAARAELRRRLSTPPPAPAAPAPPRSPACDPAGAATALPPAQWEGEVEVGEEAAAGAGAGAGAGVVWVPDSAAPRCQYCRNHFWLARRRHHCRKCGGIFCGSCSEVGGGEWPAQRVCRVCRQRR